MPKLSELISEKGDSSIKISIKNKEKNYVFELKNKRKFDYKTLKSLKNEDFIKNCNKETYEIETLIGEDLEDLKSLIQNHFEYTESTVAKIILEDWTNESRKFVKVMPTDYKRVLNEMKANKQLSNG